MGKFVDKKRGRVSTYEPPSKRNGKAKVPANCNVALAKLLTQLLKNAKKRLIQKTIRGLKEDETGNKEELEATLEYLKNISKDQVKLVALQALREQIGVDEEGIKTVATSQVIHGGEEFPEELRKFWEMSKKTKMVQTHLGQAQQTKEQVMTKKKLKKEKAKIKKQHKLEMRKEKAHHQEEPQEQQEEEIEQQEDREQEGWQGLEEQRKEQDRSEPKKASSTPKTKLINKSDSRGTSDWQKKGRNKYIQQKKDKRQQHRSQPPPQRPAPVRSEAVRVHPSWEAKKEQRKEVFLQEFQGRRTLL